MFGGFADIGFDAAAHGASLTFFEAWYATLAYALQIYFDFSGYSDMAIGLARMLNIRFPLNFDSPYQATNIADFWRRWHITLGGFLRDYLYIPLGGNRRGPLRQTGNLMATMLLVRPVARRGVEFRPLGWAARALPGHPQAIPPLVRSSPGPCRPAADIVAVVLAWVPFRAGDDRPNLGDAQGMAGMQWHRPAADDRLCTAAARAQWPTRSPSCHSSATPAP